MALTPGTHLGPYEVTTLLGAGGMGEVYRARDTKLNRDVALKILPDAFAADADRLARFRREAQVLASLNHPNIAHIYGFEDSGRIHALVLELVEGPTLAERIAQSRIPLDEALPIAKQIADALRAAHEQGIIHRDLKPANIKLRTDGTVKVLDFGLAKAMDPPSPISPEFTAAPTITTPAQMTGIGTILGTAAYMSPEQAKGQPADKRSDVWAFGCVVYEMLTGHRAFGGDDISDTLASVLKSDPRWDALPADCPPSLQSLLRRSLEKDRNRRVSDLAAALFALDEASTMSPAPAVAAPANLTPASLSRSAGWVVAAVAVVAAAALGAMLYVRRPADDAPTLRFALAAPDGWALTTNSSQTSSSAAAAAAIAVSPDGTRIAFLANTPTGRSRIWVRSVDALAAQELTGTDGASGPFWSPDSRSIGFFADNKIRRIDVGAGSPMTLCESQDYRGGAWGDGVILFSTGTTSPLMKVSSSGGVPVAATSLRKGETGHARPSFLPDGRHFVFAEYGRLAVYLGSIDSSDVQPLLQRPGAMNVVYAQGHLLFMRDTTLMAQTFDVKRLILTGEPVPVAEDVVRLATPPIALFSAAQTGLLVYQTGQSSGTTQPSGTTQLMWTDRAGKRTETVGERALYGDLELSPDGTRAAVTISTTSTGTRDVWVVDLKRGGVRTRVTSDPRNKFSPIWSPDGRQLVFDSDRQGVGELDQQASNGIDTGTVLLKSDGSYRRAYGWSADGRQLLYQTPSPQSGVYDLWVLPLAGDRKPFPYLQTSFNKRQARFSPDGRWVVYEVNESGRLDVYVSPFPKADARYLISTAGGALPRWRRDGREIYYADLTARVMAAEVDGHGATFTVGAVRPLFPLTTTGPGYVYDASADGQRFLTLEGDTRRDVVSLPMTVVSNWPATLRK